MIDGMVYVRPVGKGTWSTFYHPELKFQFSAWRLGFCRNSRSSGTMVSKGWQGPDDLNLVAGASLETAAEVVIQRMGLPLNRAMHKRAGRRRLVTGRTGKRSCPGPFYLIQYGNKDLPADGNQQCGDFSNYIPLFKATMTSFRQLMTRLKPATGPDPDQKG